MLSDRSFMFCPSGLDTFIIYFTRSSPGSSEKMKLTRHESSLLAMKNTLLFLRNSLYLMILAITIKTYCDFTPHMLSILGMS